MVFCKLIKANNECAVYTFGNTPDSMPGIVTIYPDDKRFTIEQGTETISEKTIMRVWMKYKTQIESRLFPERMSIQIG